MVFSIGTCAAVPRSVLEEGKHAGSSAIKTGQLRCASRQASLQTSVTMGLLVLFQAVERSDIQLEYKVKTESSPAIKPSATDSHEGRLGRECATRERTKTPCRQAEFSPENRRSLNRADVIEQGAAKGRLGDHEGNGEISMA